MNNVWGSIEQYGVTPWPWPIAIYLFLAGLSAGAIITALLVKWARHSANDENTVWDAIVKAGAVLAPVAIMLGLALLVLDLGKPLSFYLLILHYNFDSVMTLGVIALSIYTPIVLLFMMLIFEDLIKEDKRLFLLVPIINIVKKVHSFSKLIEYGLFALAIVVGVYTGFLLSAVSSLPLWNSPILPILFLTSGMSAGIAANLLIAIIFFKSSVDKESIKRLLILDLRVIMTEIPLIIMLFVGMYYLGGDPAIAAAKALSQGFWAKIFWVCVVGIGLLTPLVIAATSLKNHAYKETAIILNACVVLFGVIALRFYIVYAGQAVA